MIIKPTLDSGGGKNVRLFENRGGITDQDNLTMDQLLADYKMDFIIQEVMEQHPMMSALNESSLNTFRVMTYLSGKNVMVLSSLVRIGRKGAFTDNSTQGGVSCGITSDGKFKEVGYHLNTGDRILETDGGLKFKGLVLPFTGKVLNKAKELHMSAPYFRLISWDLSVTPSEEVALIEYNLRGQDISFHQLDNGPVFAPLLQDIKL